MREKSVEPQRALSVGIVFDTILIRDLAQECSCASHTIQSVLAYEAYELIAFASQIFEKEFGITPRVAGIAYEEFPADETCVDTDAFFHKLNPLHTVMNADIIIGFTGRNLRKYAYTSGKKQGVNNTYGGRAHTSGGVIVYFSDNPKLLLFTLLHELCHLFHAEHTDDKSSVMYYKEQDAIPPIHFDESSRAQILLYKNRIFSHFYYFSELFPEL